MHDNSDSNFPRVGIVTIDARKRYPAEQQAPDGNFRKRATRYFTNGKWTAWCKDDHDLFTPSPVNGGRWEPFRLPEGAEFPEPLKFPTWKAGGEYLDSLKRSLERGEVVLYAGSYGTWELPWHDVSRKNNHVDSEWTRLCLVHCDDYNGANTKTEAVGNANPRPVYVMHVHFAPGSLATDHPCLMTPAHKVCLK
jgi:hypothetical protein